MVIAILTLPWHGGGRWFESTRDYQIQKNAALCGIFCVWYMWWRTTERWFWKNRRERFLTAKLARRARAG